MKINVGENVFNSQKYTNPARARFRSAMSDKQR
jgi:hypothetical protein